MQKLIDGTQRNATVLEIQKWVEDFKSIKPEAWAVFKESVLIVNRHSATLIDGRDKREGFRAFRLTKDEIVVKFWVGPRDVAEIRKHVFIFPKLQFDWMTLLEEVFS